MFIHVHTTYSNYWQQEKFIAAFTGSKEKLAEIKDWCYNTYGRPGIIWSDFIEYGEVHFLNDKGLSLFLLRWE